MDEPDAAERWALLRTMRDTDSIVASEALSEMCGMVELMLDPHKHHGHRHPAPLLSTPLMTSAIGPSPTRLSRLFAGPRAPYAVHNSRMLSITGVHGALQTAGADRRRRDSGRRLSALLTGVA